MTARSTPVSLLERLVTPENDGAWSRFVKLYTPFIFIVARRRGLSNEDASDVVQDVFVILAQRMQMFQYDPTKSFRSWLGTVTVNRIREIARRRKLSVVQWPEEATQLEPADDLNQAELFSDEEYRQYITKRALQLMQLQFAPTTWKACWEHLVSGKSAIEIGEELGISEGAVYTAKSRVLKRLRQELAGLWE